MWLEWVLGLMQQFYAFIRSRQHEHRARSARGQSRPPHPDYPIGQREAAGTRRVTGRGRPWRVARHAHLQDVAGVHHLAAEPPNRRLPGLAVPDNHLLRRRRRARGDGECQTGRIPTSREAAMSARAPPRPGDRCTGPPRGANATSLRDGEKPSVLTRTHVAAGIRGGGGALTAWKDPLKANTLPNDDCACTFSAPAVAVAPMRTLRTGAGSDTPKNEEPADDRDSDREAVRTGAKA
jgi:hypothetical protein